MIENAAASVVGREAVRAGQVADAVDGITPRIVVEPATPDAVAALVGWASREKLSTLVRGAGTKLGWGPAPRSIDVLISMTRLHAVVAHRHGDLTATIEAGAPLANVNRALGSHRQWIPLDPPFADRATIGGLVATNDSGPRRHRYGAPRDLIIGVEFAKADGRLAKGGGIVVKNVAGYDLPRLLSGSFGSLGVIVSATFKLYPLTAASRTLIVPLTSPADLGGLSAKVMSGHLTPTALEFATHPLRLIVRFESIDASVHQQSQAFEKLMGELGFGVQAAADEDEQRVWTEHARFVADSRGALVKVSVLPTQIPETLALIDRLAGTDGYTAAGRAGLGVFLARIFGDVESQKRAIDGLRSSLQVGRGSAVVISSSPELRATVDVWGSIGDGLPLMKAVKQQFDPVGVLSPGRGPGGI
jgi:glycolate oxidase FAD binding subunit